METHSESSFHTPKPLLDRSATGLVALMGLLPVASLLAWVFGLGSFRSWFLGVSAPALVLLVILASWAAKTGRNHISAIFTAGVFGGLLGTLGYDLFRIPFVIAGARLFSPIDSYGILILGAQESSAWTGFTGWAYHFSNGIGFGIFYAAVALGRRWWWGLAWAMVLETATILTPFAEIYGLAGRWGLIAVAYAAHIFYGLPLGLIVEKGREFARWTDEISKRAAVFALLALLVALLLWHRPPLEPLSQREGRSLAAGPSSVVRSGRMVPEWIRVPVEGCATLRNDDRQTYTAELAEGAPRLRPGEETRLCFSEPGTHRLKLSDEPYSGGFVIVDHSL